MNIRGAVVTASVVVLLLSSCASSPTPSAEREQTPAPHPTVSTPAFLLATQTSRDLLPATINESVELQPSSTRYQGRWDDHDVFLATDRTGSVCLVTGILNQSESWTSGCGAENGVVTSPFPDGGTVKYVPMASSVTPQGWTRLSDYVFAM